MARLNKLLAGGAFLLAAGVAATFVPVPNREGAVRVVQSDTSSEEDSPFEISIAVMSLDRFLSLVHADESRDFLHGYELVATDFARRIESDSTLRHPDFAFIAGSERDSVGFPYAYRHGARLTGHEVGCLILKQVGRRSLKQVTLDLYRITLGNAEDLEGPLELQSFEPEDDESADRRIVSRDSVHVHIGDMDTGRKIVIPLYMTYLFERDSGRYFRTFSVFQGTAHVPLQLTYLDGDDDWEDDIRGVLGYPAILR